MEGHFCSTGTRRVSFVATSPKRRKQYQASGRKDSGYIGENFDGATITLRQLLSHTSGVRREWFPPEEALHRRVERLAL